MVKPESTAVDQQYVPLGADRSFSAPLPLWYSILQVYIVLYKSPISPLSVVSLQRTCNKNNAKCAL